MGKQKVKKILIFGHSNIGDICYDMSVVNPLRSKFNDAEISFVTSVNGEDIGNLVKGVDKVIVFDKNNKDKGLAGYLRFILRIRREKFDFLLILRNIQMHYFFNIPKVLKLNKDEIKDNKKHVAEKYMLLLEKYGIGADKVNIDFQFSKSDENFVQKLFTKHNLKKGAKKIGIMPLAAWPLKSWPTESVNKLIDIIKDKTDCEVFLFGKTGYSAWDGALKENISQKAVSRIDKDPLLHTLCLVKNMDIFIGPDSSLLHFASCMGVKTIGLYGATDVDFIYPLFDKKNMIISKAGLDCMPCYPGPRGGSCGASGPAECMQAISAEEVFNKIKEVLS